jgi:hypothetical protein
MNVGMKAQIPGPGVQHRQQAQLGAKVFVIAADVAQIQDRSVSSRLHSIGRMIPPITSPAKRNNP